MDISIKKHEHILKNEIFFIKTKWPHFDILFKAECICATYRCK